jgi:hypothetical protein
MGDMDVTQRSASGGWEPYPNSDSIPRRDRRDKVEPSGLVLDPARGDADAEKIPDPPATVLSPAAFANPALRAADRAKDPCSDARPTRILVPPHPRGAYEPPAQVEFSCTKQGGLCLTKEEEEHVQALRQAVCISTGVDPMRFEKVASSHRGPAVDRDRGWERDQRDASSLRNLELMTENPFGAAAYGSARVAGVSDEKAQRAAQAAAMVGDVALAVGAAHAQRAAHAAAAVTNGPAEKPSSAAVAPKPAPTTEGGTIRSVNRGLPLGRTPGTRDMNCANCAVATDAMLAGSPAAALPGQATDARDVSAMYGKPWAPMRGIAHMQIEMTAAGSGSRGIVFGERNGDIGHFFNVVNQKGTVRFLDGQTGEPASLADGYARFWLLRTK